MGRFAEILKENSIKPSQIARASTALEAGDEKDVALRNKRELKRSAKPEAKYEAEGIAKPKLGRGVSTKQLAAAEADKPLSRQVRAKTVRAVNALLAKKGKDKLEAHALFAGVKTRAGAKPVVAKKK